MIRPCSKTWREGDGRPIHDADCNFWDIQICTCGLIRHLLPEFCEASWFAEEWGIHDRQIERLRELRELAAKVQEVEG